MGITTVYVELRGIGTPRGTRTPGLVVRNHALYPLSYGRMSAGLLADPAAIKETSS